MMAKVFICWSGEQSKQVAIGLHRLIGHVLQRVDRFMSEKDIPSGADWPRVIKENLKDATFGVVCVTSANKESPWMHFEAGAILHRLPEQAVCPYLFGIEPAQLKPPLAHLQGRMADDEGTLRLLLDINAACPKESQVEEANIREVFDAMWDKDLGDPLAELAAVADYHLDDELDQGEALKEILLTVREIARQQHSTSGSELSDLEVVLRNQLAMNTTLKLMEDADAEVKRAEASGNIEWFEKARCEQENMRRMCGHLLKEATVRCA